MRTAPSPRLRKRTNSPRPDGSGKGAAKAKAARRGAEADRQHTEAEATAAETDILAAALPAAAVSDLNQLHFLWDSAGVGLSTPAMNVARKCLGRLISK